MSNSVPIPPHYLEAIDGNESMRGNVCIKASENGEGKGLFAASDFVAGQLIFEEEPLAAMQVPKQFLSHPYLHHVHALVFPTDARKQATRALVC